MTKTFAEDVQEALTRLDKQTAEKINFKDERGLMEAYIRLRAVNSLPEDIARLEMRINEMGRVAIALRQPDLENDPVAKLSLISSVEGKGDDLNVGDYFPAQNTDGSTEKKPPVVVIPPMVESKHEWDAPLQDQQRVKAQIEERSKIYLPGNPKMKVLLEEMQAIDEKLESAYQTAQNRFDLQYQQLISKRNDLQGRMPEYKKIKADYDKLVGEQSLRDTARLPYEQVIVQMKKQMEMYEFAGEKERVNLHYSELINVSERPESPNRGKLVLFSLVIGIGLAIGVPFLIEYLDHTLSNLEQVESAFRMRGLGIVPQIDASSVGAAALISHDESRKDALIENFRVIRTNVISMGSLTKEPHVIMVTSAMPKEGKTVVSSNLAVSFAHTGARTLLVDTDLRRGRLHRLFGYRKDPGLSNVLLGEVPLEQACRPTGQENLSILSAGRHLETGTELLGSPKFRELMQTLRERYDRIVVDTPPVLGLSETSIMQGLVDGVLFVIWTGNTPARSAKAAVDMLAANGANFYGFVLNRLDLSATANYYQYYYYSHDYYYQHPLENA
jgi:capsular exopolysaccharide synthesis family protein